MNIHSILKALKDHAKEEVRIHKEVFEDADGDIKDIVQKHLSETMSIHKIFWKKLKKALKESR